MDLTDKKSNYRSDTPCNYYVDELQSKRTCLIKYNYSYFRFLNFWGSKIDSLTNKVKNVHDWELNLGPSVYAKIPYH